VSNDYLAELVQRYPKQFIAFGSVDPWLGEDAVREAERCVRDLGLRGLKFHPSIQRFFPDDERFYPLWQKCSELGVPVLFHSGMTGIGAGTPGGGGIKTKYCRPIPHIDDIAADFPELTVIMAHPAFPWVEEQLAVLVHKPNVFMDLSGWSPKYFDPMIVQYANTRIPDKMMFGSDYAMISPERWLSDFEQAPFSDEVRPRILLENAKRVLKLDF
jgi:predicted TIM-barrel fold metal-dependent hydrolase